MLGCILAFTLEVLKIVIPVICVTLTAIFSIYAIKARRTSDFKKEITDMKLKVYSKIIDLINHLTEEKSIPQDICMENCASYNLESNDRAIITYFPYLSSKKKITELIDKINKIAADGHLLTEKLTLELSYLMGYVSNLHYLIETNKKINLPCTTYIIRNDIKTIGGSILNEVTKLYKQKAILKINNIYPHDKMLTKQKTFFDENFYKTELKQLVEYFHSANNKINSTHNAIKKYESCSNCNENCVLSNKNSEKFS